MHQQVTDFTDAQLQEIGWIVADNWGADFQTSFSDEKHPKLYWQVGPNTPVRSAVIKANGTVYHDE